MPPKKRTLQEADSNASKSAPAPKNQKRAAEQENAPEQDEVEVVAESASTHTSHEHECPKDRNNEDWICIDQPFWDYQFAEVHALGPPNGGEHESDEEEDEDEPDEEELHEKYKTEVADKKVWGKPATEMPEHKWKMSWAAWKQLCELRIQESYCNPDNFGMHVFTDFEGYGLVALIETRLAEFNKEYRKKVSDQTPSSVRHMWAVLAALGHWLQFDEQGVLMRVTHVDDGERVNQLVALMSCAFLTGLDALDRMGWLKSDSEIRDLGLVMSIWIDWAKGLPDYGIGDDGETDWRVDVRKYANKGGIDLKKDGCSAVRENLIEMEDPPALKGPAKAGRWKWPKNYKDYKASYGMGSGGFIPYGLPSYDITKWTRAMRKEYSLDGEDPLADIPEKDLREGNIMLA